jgi:transcriptional regulator with PAS, ATPase and Fis domain
MPTHASPLQVAFGSTDPFPEIDGNSPEVRRLKQHMLRVARDGEVTVLILGESGTGKERIAHAIHRNSPRRRGAFVVVNCAGLAPTLVEDELFGHVRGAFTGAIDNRPGPFERANGGTIFLDEIGDLTPELQMKLLRVLQERTVQRLGSRDESHFDVRVIAATHVDLASARQRGRFREDLYYRLKVYELRVPPLRSRGAVDIQTIAMALLQLSGERRGRRGLVMDAAVLDALGRYRWPGNVRELENTIECMVVAAGPGERAIARHHLPDGFGVDAVGLSQRTVALPSREQLVEALARYRHRPGLTAAALGLSRHQLYRLVRRYEIHSLNEVGDASTSSGDG